MSNFNSLRGHKISSIAKNSPAEKAGFRLGETLYSINGTVVEDIFDYRFLVQDTRLTCVVRTPEHTEETLHVRKEYYEDLGIEFENALMDCYRSCTNKCVFCFIDQNPPGMRETLYFKDDDSRLSFLQGNYVTLTNMSDHDIDKIIKYHLSPINVSIHTTNPELRCKMLNNRFAGDALKKVKRLADAGITMNSQIVLVPEMNDGEELDRTIRDLSEMYPHMESLSVVPIGITRYRDKLYPVRTFTGEECGRVIDQIEGWQKKIYEKHGARFVQASDEFYIVAGRELPAEENYEGYIQLDNGVGMMRMMTEEVKQGIKDSVYKIQSKGLGKLLLPGLRKYRSTACVKRDVSLATGKLAYPFIKKYTQWIMKEFPNVHVKVYAIRNDFFGPTITVSGLITGQDLKKQLTGQHLGTELMLPVNMFRSGEEVFLDDMTRTELENALQVRINIVKSDGCDFVEAILGILPEHEYVGHSPYEPDEI
ncbi:MAG: DUF512 domain-containing protein [Lachnospiraceae bacterium]|nr:DUF512 domain-containing protein [Lachnospiraceae bacterium]